MISISPKKIIFLALLSSFILLNTTCKKKISDHPFEMEGVWFADDLFCGLILVIENNGEGKTFVTNFGVCFSNNLNTKGTVKFKGDLLYVGSSKFTIFNEPILVTSNDSIYAPDEYDLTGNNFKKYKSLAKMTLQKSNVLGPDETFNLVKYIDY